MYGLLCFIIEKEVIYNITIQSYWDEFTEMWTDKYCTIIDISKKRILDVLIIGLRLGNYIYTTQAYFFIFSTVVLRA